MGFNREPPHRQHIQNCQSLKAKGKKPTPTGAATTSAGEHEVSVSSRRGDAWPTPTVGAASRTEELWDDRVGGLAGARDAVLQFSWYGGVSGARGGVTNTAAARGRFKRLGGGTSGPAGGANFREVKVWRRLSRMAGRNLKFFNARDVVRYPHRASRAHFCLFQVRRVVL